MYIPRSLLAGLDVLHDLSLIGLRWVNIPGSSINSPNDHETVRCVPTKETISVLSEVEVFTNRKTKGIISTPSTILNTIEKEKRVSQ